ncbi:MAG: ferrochelatase [Rhodospirillales bacterium]
MTKRAIILFNLGGPDRPDSVQPFLFNLFNDPAIIGAPGPVRWLIAKLISTRRAPVAREIYAHLGGGSPLLGLTEDQARALETALASKEPTTQSKVFVCMRYWHPMSDAVAREVKAYGPDEIVLLPLYPQYSGTTSGSSIKDWQRAAKAIGLSKPTRTVCCYPQEAGFIAAVADLTAKALDASRGAVGESARLLFSAHGLPKKVIEGGDPYQAQVEQSAAAVVARLARPDLDWRVCYQSRVGPLEWIGPSTEDEIRRAGKDGKAIVLVPIAFVSEHSETLVELDIEYRELAEEVGVTAYHRVPAVATQEAFVQGLADMVLGASLGEPLSHLGHRLCSADRSQCPCPMEKAS